MSGASVPFKIVAQAHTLIYGRRVRAGHVLLEGRASDPRDLAHLAAVLTPTDLMITTDEPLPINTEHAIDSVTTPSDAADFAAEVLDTVAEGAAEDEAASGSEPKKDSKKKSAPKNESHA